MSNGFRNGAGKIPVTGARRRLQKPLRYKMSYPRKQWKIRQLRTLLPEMRYKIA
jgi:hypothetical protein